MIEDVTFVEFARLVRTSEPTLRRRLIDATANVVLSKGKTGEAYQIDARAGVAWWLAVEQEERDDRAARLSAIGAQQFELLGADTALAGFDLEGLTPGEKSAHLQSELFAIKLGELRGALVRRDDFDAVAAQFEAKVRDTLEPLPARLGARVKVATDVSDALARLIARDLADLADAANLSPEGKSE